MVNSCSFSCSIPWDLFPVVNSCSFSLGKQDARCSKGAQSFTRKRRRRRRKKPAAKKESRYPSLVEFQQNIIQVALAVNPGLNETYKLWTASSESSRTHQAVTYISLWQLGGKEGLGPKPRFLRWPLLALSFWKRSISGGTDSTVLWKPYWDYSFSAGLAPDLPGYMKDD